jgi:hypothetical protein
MLAQIDPLTMQSQFASHAVKFALENATTTDGEVVAAVTGKKIRVLAMWAGNYSAAEATIFFESGTTTAITATMSLAADGAAGAVLILPFSPVGWFETAAGEALTVSVAGSTPTVGVNIVYIEI